MFEPEGSGPNPKEHDVPSPLHPLLPQPERIAEAEYRYAAAAYTGRDHEPSAEDLARFAIATELTRAFAVLRGPPRSLLPRPVGRELTFLRRGTGSWSVAPAAE
jgi:hypothetical protein